MSSKKAFNGLKIIFPLFLILTYEGNAFSSAFFTCSHFIFALFSVKPLWVIEEARERGRNGRGRGEVEFSTDWRFMLSGVPFIRNQLCCSMSRVTLNSHRPLPASFFWRSLKLNKTVLHQCKLFKACFCIHGYLRLFENISHDLRIRNKFIF